MAGTTPTASGTNPLTAITGTLKQVFQDASDVYFGYQQRVSALEILENETNKQQAAYSPADKANPAQLAIAFNTKNVAIGAGILLLAGIVIARALK